MLLLLLYLLLYLSATATSKAISGIFTSFDSLEWKGNGYPQEPHSKSWFVTMSWRIDGSQAAAGDTFKLTLPYVFKFTTTDSSVDLKVDQTSYATCKFQPGETLIEFSELECIMLSSVVPTTYAIGTITFSMVFACGGSLFPIELKAASQFDQGVNEISFWDGKNQLSIQTTFAKSAAMDNLVYKNRGLPVLNKVSLLAGAGTCPYGYLSGTLGMTIETRNIQLDCSNIHGGISNDLNPWHLPKSISTDFDFTLSCSTYKVTMNYQKIPEGYRPFLDSLGKITGAGFQDIKYENYFRCSDERWLEKGWTISWDPKELGLTGSDGWDVVYTTSTWTGSYTQLTTMPFSTGIDKTMTIIVQVPDTTAEVEPPPTSSTEFYPEESSSDMVFETGKTSSFSSESNPIERPSSTDISSSIEFISTYTQDSDDTAIEATIANSDLDNSNSMVESHSSSVLEDEATSTLTFPDSTPLETDSDNSSQTFETMNSLSGETLSASNVFQTPTEPGEFTTTIGQSEGLISSLEEEPVESLSLNVPDDSISVDAEETNNSFRNTDVQTQYSYESIDSTITAELESQTTVTGESSLLDQSDIFSDQSDSHITSDSAIPENSEPTIVVSTAPNESSATTTDTSNSNSAEKSHSDNFTDESTGLSNISTGTNDEEHASTGFSDTEENTNSLNTDQGATRTEPDSTIKVTESDDGGESNWNTNDDASRTESDSDVKATESKDGGESNWNTNDDASRTESDSDVKATQSNDGGESIWNTNSLNTDEGATRTEPDSTTKVTESADGGESNWNSNGDASRTESDSDVKATESNDGGESIWNTNSLNTDEGATRTEPDSTTKVTESADGGATRTEPDSTIKATESKDGGESNWNSNSFNTDEAASRTEPDSIVKATESDADGESAENTNSSNTDEGATKTEPDSTIKVTESDDGGESNWNTNSLNTKDAATRTEADSTVKATESDDDGESAENNNSMSTNSLNTNDAASRSESESANSATVSNDGGESNENSNSLNTADDASRTESDLTINPTVSNDGGESIGNTYSLNTNDAASRSESDSIINATASKDDFSSTIRSQAHSDESSGGNSDYARTNASSDTTTISQPSTVHDSSDKQPTSSRSIELSSVIHTEDHLTSRSLTSSNLTTVKAEQSYDSNDRSQLSTYTTIDTIAETGGGHLGTYTTIGETSRVWSSGGDTGNNRETSREETQGGVDSNVTADANGLRSTSENGTGHRGSSGRTESEQKGKGTGTNGNPTADSQPKETANLKGDGEYIKSDTESTYQVVTSMLGDPTYEAQENGGSNNHSKGHPDNDNLSGNAHGDKLTLSASNGFDGELVEDKEDEIPASRNPDATDMNSGITTTMGVGTTLSKVYSRSITEHTMLSYIDGGLYSYYSDIVYIVLAIFFYAL
ncbi:uncharacterized protein J8A68_002086 [[Candida] subhashii]|uniref:Agglutinin-like protein N-terminal domain-containing protein n=1 Tax=[Candida] subhashii TaxID=561895 RepID=A0A8J5UJB4_9ASCO|nr:uncharacterized protein J8A68_002086 [[Candida] subhashii]KAG7664413.1 hypothetical protein J8A68_002086 [[Candida] subhashii]